MDDESRDVEVTEAMLVAGLAEIAGTELIDAWDGYLSKVDLLRSIYLAMVNARLDDK